MKIKLTSVFVDDQQKALGFYTEVLEEPEGTQLQLALNDNPAAKAYQQ